MLTSLAATHQPRSAASGRSSRSAASRPTLDPSAEKYGKRSCIVPSSAAATSSSCPGAAFLDASGTAARPRTNADTDGGPSRTVRWPPTTGTSYWLEACRIPSSTRRAVLSDPTIVSTRPRGRPPIAATSFTLATTAPTPAP